MLKLENCSATQELAGHHHVPLQAHSWAELGPMSHLEAFRAPSNLFTTTLDFSGAKVWIWVGRLRAPHGRRKGSVANMELHVNAASVTSCLTSLQ